MKKLIFMAAMLAVMVSCEKGIKDDSKPQQQAVTIRIGSATKADAITTINSLMPESLTLTLTSKTTNEQLQITTGAMISSGLRSSKLSNYDTDDTSTNL
jgi:hypothetical protein